MIPRSQASVQTLKQKLSNPDWQKELASAIRDPKALLNFLGLKPQQLTDQFDINNPFPLKVPLDFISRMQVGNPQDPLLLQVLPLKKERLINNGYSTDPVGDINALMSPGLMQKYQGRALIITTGACGIHCRYCFRRHFPYSQENPANSDWQGTLAELEKNSDISEIILSGGDPLCLGDDRLYNLVKKLETVSHVKRIRFHTRLPVVLPNRVNKLLLKLLDTSSKQMIMVIHCNHANEISPSVTHAMQSIAATGTTLLNQSVLLRGINDNSTSLIDLSESLFNSRVLPYYLHMLDKVQGANHFDVAQDVATSLIKEMREQLPGYLVPLLVREESGAAYKTPI